MGLLKSVIADARSARSARAPSGIPTQSESSRVGNRSMAIPASSTPGDYLESSGPGKALRDEPLTGNAQISSYQAERGQALDGTAMNSAATSVESMDALPASIQSAFNETSEPVMPHSQVKSAADIPFPADNSLARGSEAASETGKTKPVARGIESGGLSPGSDRQSVGVAGIPASVAGQSFGDDLDVGLDTELKLDPQHETFELAEGKAREQIQSFADKSLSPVRGLSEPDDVETGKTPDKQPIQATADPGPVSDRRALPNQPAVADNPDSISSGPLDVGDTRVDEIAIPAKMQPSPVTAAPASPSVKHPPMDAQAEITAGSQVATEALTRSHQVKPSDRMAQKQLDTTDQVVREPLAPTAASVGAAVADPGSTGAGPVSRVELDAKLSAAAERVRAVSMQPQSNKPSLRQAPVRQTSPSRLTPIEVRSIPEVRIGQVDVIVEAPTRSRSRSTTTPRPSPGLVSRHYLRRL